MTERWVTAVNTGGIYEVSDQGRVRRTMSGRVLRPRVRSGYTRAALGLPEGRRDVSVHHLVLESFVGPRPDGTECNHKNGVKTDNRPENLEWVSRVDNIRHGWDTGLYHASKGERNGRSKLTWDEARAIRVSTGRVRDVGRQYGVSGYVVSQIRRGLLWAEDDIDITNPRWRTA
jgi:hypothetical protein